MDQVSRALLIAGGSGVDPDFEYVAALLHGDGTNGAQNNTFTDSSSNNFTVTRNGNPTQGTFNPYGSNWSNYFDGTADYLSAPDSLAFTFDGDFTVEAWVFKTSGAATVAAHWPGAVATNCSWALSTNASDRLSFSYGVGAVNGSVTATSTTVTPNTWNHIAVSRSGTTIRLFVNGVQDATTGTVSGALNNSSASFLIGVLNTTDGVYLTGFISNIRVVKGTAVYVSTFTPSMVPLTAIANTSLLTCQSNSFIDSSANNFAITRNGDVAVHAFSPFAPIAPYSAGPRGGSGYFDGTGDWLTVPDNAVFDFGTGDFTAEAWVFHPVSTGVLQTYFQHAGGGFRFQRTVAGALVVSQAGSADIASGGSIPIGAWTHLAVSRSGATMRLFVNGAVVATSTSTPSFNGTSAPEIGAAAGSARLLGFISNLRIVKGTAVYTGAFTPPIAPVATSGSASAASYSSTTNVNTSFAAGNTSLLMNFADGGVIDNAMQVSFETVGNAQISTAQSKFGGSSIAFDGTGDYLRTPASPIFVYGTGDFTIELWVYIGASGDYGLVDHGNNSQANLFLYINSTTPRVFFNNANVAAGPNISLNTWTHIAVTRASGSIRVFTNGVSGTPVSNSTSLVSAGPIGVGANYLNGQSLNGYIDDLRITRGLARYTADFSPPTAPFFDR